MKTSKANKRTTILYVYLSLGGNLAKGGPEALGLSQYLL
jgi:hypothetical protein